MTTNLHFEEAFPSIFESVVIAFKNKSKDIAHTLLMNLIHVLKTQNDSLKNIQFEIEQDRVSVEDMNLDEFYDNMYLLQDNLKKLLELSVKQKGISDIFMHFYKAVDELYTTVLVVTNEVGVLESYHLHELKLKNAS